MKTAAVISELNPLHSGHAGLFRAAREMGADSVMTLMSGDFVQRGVPSIVERYTRTHMALLAGADLVLSYPVRYATGSAERFAEYAVRILNGLGCVDWLVFGSESGDVDGLMECAGVLVQEPPEFRERLHAALRAGRSYPSAASEALPEYAGLLRDPNNILGVEYCKALIRTGSSIRPVTVKRLSSMHSDRSIRDSGASAGAIRSLLLEAGHPGTDRSGGITQENVHPGTDRSGGISQENVHPGTDRSGGISQENVHPGMDCSGSFSRESSDPGSDQHVYDQTGPDMSAVDVWTVLSEVIPAEACEVFRQSVEKHGLVRADLFSKLLLEKLWATDDPAELTQFLDVTDDLSRTLIQRRREFTGWDGFMYLCASRSLTISHVSRACLHIALSLGRSDQSEGALLTQLLGCRRGANRLVSAVSGGTVPVVARPASPPDGLSLGQSALLKEEIRLSNLYEVFRSFERGLRPVHACQRVLLKV